jgi:CheY-like chemotaxis protein
VTICISVESQKSDKILLRFSVIDTGIGIPEEKIDLIFEKFTQADTSNSRRFGGTGLGLAISKQLVEMMNGDIGVISKVGEGSNFWFTVQLEKQSKTEWVEKPEKVDFIQTSNSVLKILLVEDDMFNQEVAQAMLTNLEFDVDVVGNGIEAIKALETKSYDLVLMDIQMPEMNGVEATKIIRNPESKVLNKDIPVIALTAHAMKGDREKFFEIGMNDYISKPISLKAVRELLDKWNNIILKNRELTQS